MSIDTLTNGTDKEGKKPQHTSMLLTIKDKLQDAIRGIFSDKISPKEAIHPDFRIKWEIEDVTWYQNHDTGPWQPEYKIGFYFNDPSILDNCPWTGKFGKNTNKNFSEYQYFFVGYGNPNNKKDQYGIKEMCDWAAQFEHPTLMKYDGTIIKNIKN